jgi:hypothetical protein
MLSCLHIAMFIYRCQAIAECLLAAYRMAPHCVWTFLLLFLSLAGDLKFAVCA